MQSNQLFNAPSMLPGGTQLEAIDLSTFANIGKDSTKNDSVKDNINDDTELFINQSDDVGSSIFNDVDVAEKHTSIINDDDQEPTTIVNDSIYKQMLKSMSDAGYIPVIDYITSDGVDIPIDEYPIQSVEEYNQILQLALGVKNKEIEDSYINKSNMSELLAHLISVESAGGSIENAINEFLAYQNPLSSTDLSTEEGCIKVLMIDYQQSGIDEERAALLIDALRSKGTSALQTEAYKSEDRINKRIEKNRQEELKKLEEDKLNKIAVEKEFRKNLSTSIKSKFSLSDSNIRKLIDGSMQRDETGACQIDREYMRMRNDPDLASTLAMFILMNDEYKKQVVNAEVVEHNKNTFNKISSSKISKGVGLSISDKKTRLEQEAIDSEIIGRLVPSIKLE